MKLSKEEMREWILGYIEAQSNPKNSKNDELHWAIQKFIDLEHENPEACWDAILNILHQ